MTESLKTLSQWFSKQPKWLQFAAKRLLEQDKINAKDISELAALCQQEAIGQLSQSDYIFHNDAFATDSATTIRLNSLSSIEGVNALAPRQPLEFGKSNITIIYGLNGSGKSGYVRLLKHMCGARYPGKLHQNIYSSSLNEQRATIQFEKNGIAVSRNWTSQLPIDELKNVDIFDTSVGRIFMNGEDEVCYEPPVLSYFSLLIAICEKVGEILDTEAAKYQSNKLTISPELKTTAESIWLESISHETCSGDVEKYCSFTDENKSKIKKLRQRLAESDPSDQAARIRNKKKHLDILLQDIQKHFAQLSDENCHQIIAKKENAILQKKCAEAAAQKIFSDEHLKDIGSDIWKELWVAARNYSTSSAYKDQEYPNLSNDSRCVLCQQELSAEAKARLASFNKFVKDEMQYASHNAAREFKNAIEALDDIPTLDMLKIRMDAGGINQDKISIPLYNCFTFLKERKESLQALESTNELPTITCDLTWIDSIKKLSTEYNVQAENYEKDVENNNHILLKTELNTLLAKEWLAENYEEIKREIEKLKLLNQIQNAKKLINTRSLSSKKGELAETLITEAFTQRFNAELQKLNAGSIKVELIKSKVSKGRVLHKIQLCKVLGSSLAEVLSEGENKIVSIAAFLADVTGKSKKSPFIFDDPISSLDQNFEEAVVQRLIELSQDKQVLIFTHRLSLLSTIKHFAERKSIPVDVISIRSVDWGTGEPAPIPLAQNEIKTTLNVLINEKISEARKAYDNSEFTRVETDIKSICSDFRTLVERVIENDLLCGVLQRHRRPIHTLKLNDLQKITRADCEKLTLLMTKYSRFEHSQPLESPIELPNVSELLDDLLCLKNWREEYTTRTVIL